MLTNISLTVGTIVSLLAVVGFLWKISSSFTKTEVSIVTIEKEILEIKVILNKTDDRIDKVCEKAVLNEYRIYAIEGDVKDIRDNCKEIQQERRQERLG